MTDRLTALRARQAEVQDEMESLLATAADDDDRDLNEEEQARFDDLRAEDDRLNVRIRTEDDMQRRRAAAARPVAPMPPAGPDRPSVPATVRPQLDPGVGFTRIVRAMAANNMDRRAAAAWMDRVYGAEMAEIVANMEESTDVKGGFLVDEMYSREFITLLRPRVAVRARGARPIPIPAGNLTMRKQTSTSQAGYIGERQNIPVSGLEVGQLKFSAKRLAAIVPISNVLLRHASQDVDMLVREDLRDSVGIKEDQQFLRGTGSATAPAGLLNLTPSSGKLPATAGQALAAVDADLGRVRLVLENGNVPMTNCGYIISPRIKEFLETLRDGNGNKAYPEIADNRIGTYPYTMTTSVPDNLGAGTDESEIYFADFSQVLIGESYQVTLAASDVASYDDGTGMRSAFQTDETLIRVIVEHDLQLRYDAAVAILQAVTWAP